MKALSALASMTLWRGLRTRADRLRNARRWDAAAEQYGLYLRARPRDGAIWVQRGHCLKEAGRLDEALGAYLRAEALMPRDGDLQLQLGHLNKVRGDSQGALERYRKSATLDPANEDAALEMRGLAPRAVIEPDSVAWPSARAVLAWYEENPAEEDEFSPQPDGEPADPRDSNPGTTRSDGYDLSRLNASLRSKAQALLRTLAETPNDVEALAALATCLDSAGDLVGAERALRRAASIATGDAGLQRAHGAMLVRAGLVREARAALRRAFRLRPQLAIAQELRRLGASTSYLAKAAPAPPRMARVFLEISDLFVVMTERLTATGIQRVQCNLVAEIMNGANASGGPALDFVICQDRRIWSLGRQDLQQLLQHLENQGGGDLEGRRYLIETARANASWVEPQSGDVMLSTGVLYRVPDLARCREELSRAGVRVGTIVHDFIPLTHPEVTDPVLTVDFATSMAEALVQLDFAIPNSEFTASEMRRLMTAGGYRALPLRVVPLAHSLETGGGDRQDRWRGPIANLKGQDYVLCVGTYSAHKNQELLVNVWRLMASEGVEVPLLLLVGHKAHGVDDLLRMLAATQNLDGKVRLLQGLDDDQVQTLYRSCLFSVFPSKVEGWGLPVGESLSFGKVCVASRAASMPEVGGEFALYIDPFDARQAADLISALLNDRQRLTFLERRIASGFARRTWRDYANDLLAALRDLPTLDVATSESHGRSPSLPPGQVLKICASPHAWEFGVHFPPRAVQERITLRKLILADGWHLPETWGVWMAGPRASVALKVDATPGERIHLVLQLRAAPWACDNQVVVRSTCGASTVVDLPPMRSDENERSTPRNFLATLECVVTPERLVELNIDVLGAPRPSWWGEARVLVAGLVRVLFLPAEDAARALPANQWLQPRTAGAGPRLRALGAPQLERALQGGMSLVEGWRWAADGQLCMAGARACTAFRVAAAPGEIIRVVAQIAHHDAAGGLALEINAGDGSSVGFEIAPGLGCASLWVDVQVSRDRRIELTFSGPPLTSDGRAPGDRIALLGVLYGSRNSLEGRVRLAEASALAPPQRPRAAQREAERRGARFVVAGHFKGAYSLADMNRRLALAFEDLSPGAVQIEQVEGRPVRDLSDVPALDGARLKELAGGPAPDDGPLIVISQHWPIWSRPDESDLMLAFVPWEESLLPKRLVDQLNADFDGVLAPASSVAKALVDSGVRRPVAIIGNGPDLRVLLEIGAQRLATRGARQPSKQAPFTFLHVSSCLPRKGVDALLSAYVAAFTPDAPVRLLIKGVPNPHNNVAEQVDRLQANGPIPEIVFINADLPRDEIDRLYAEAHAVVLPSRGEGFSLPAVEALAAALPVIATGFGGQLDFLDSEVARLVDFALTPSKSHVASAGSLWAEPDVADLANALREAFERGGAGESPQARRRAQIGWERARAIGDGPDWARRTREAALDIFDVGPVSPKVAWVSTWGLACGVAEYSAMLLERYPQAEAEVTVLCDRRTLAEHRMSPGLAGVIAAWEVHNAASVESLARDIDRLGADVVVIQHQKGLITWRDLTLLLRHRLLAHRQVVVQLHNVKEAPPLASRAGVELADALRAAARVMVHTLADVAFLKDYGLEHNVTLFPHGVTPPLAARAARPLGRGSAPLIGSYGFFLPHKGIDQLILALATLRKTWPNARLRLVNAEFPDAVSREEIGRCQTLAKRLQLFEAIEWRTDFLSNGESRGLLSECDLVVLPYRTTQESASGAVRVALASGAPVAVTASSIFDDVRDATHRLQGGEAPEIATDVAALLADPASRASLQAVAAEWSRRYAWPDLAERMRGMIAGLVAGARIPGGALRVARLSTDGSPVDTAAVLAEGPGLGSDWATGSSRGLAAE